MQPAPELPERIVDAALTLAEDTSWEAVRLHEVAARLAISLDDIRFHFREKEAIAEAWFDRADRAMLWLAQQPELSSLAPRDRLHRLIMAWLQALAPHRRATRQIIFGKLEPGHLHVQIPGLLRVSRTVQWIREAAQRDATYLRRAIEETLLTTVYLVVFVYWMRDDSAGATKTSQLLERALNWSERLPGCMSSRPAARAAASRERASDSVNPA